MKKQEEILKTVRAAEQLWKKPKAVWNKVKKHTKKENFAGGFK